MTMALSIETSHQSNDDIPMTAKKMCMDDMLREYCGEFGRWQLKHFVLTSVCWGFVAFHMMVMVFADNEPHWTCLAGSAGSGCNAAAASVCRQKPGSWAWVGGHGSTTVSEWGLVCGDKFKVGLVRAMFFVGWMIGGVVFGHISDSFLGRKRSLGLACALNAIFGGLTALSPNYIIYVIFRFLTGFNTGGVGLCSYVLASEPIGPSKRGTVGMCTFYFFSGGIVLLSGIAYIFQTWRYLYIASSTPSFLYIIIVLPFISESPRWYLVRGRVTEAMKVLSTISSSNGKHLPSGILLALDEEINMLPSSDDQNFNSQSSGKKVARVGSIIDLVRSPVTRRRLLIAMSLTFVCNLVYDGISLNVGNMRSNLYLNVLLNAVGEMPAFVITALLMDRFGRRAMTVATMWFSGFFCLMGSLVSNVTVRMACGILGVFGMAGTYNLLYIYTSELFPTVVRNAALGCTSQTAQLGAMLASFMVILGGSLPFAVYAACAVMGGILAMFLPETSNQPLYDTITGMEAALA